MTAPDLCTKYDRPHEIDVTGWCPVCETRPAQTRGLVWDEPFLVGSLDGGDCSERGCDEPARWQVEVIGYGGLPALAASAEHPTEQACPRHLTAVLERWAA